MLTSRRTLFVLSSLRPWIKERTLTTNRLFRIPYFDFSIAQEIEDISWPVSVMEALTLGKVNVVSPTYTAPVLFMVYALLCILSYKPTRILLTRIPVEITTTSCAAVTVRKFLHRQFQKYSPPPLGSKHTHILIADMLLIST